MSAALGLIACALLTWPAPVVAQVRRGPRHRAFSERLDKAAPRLLGAAGALTVLLWDSSPRGVVRAALTGILLTLLLSRARARATNGSAPDTRLSLALTVAALLLRTGAPPATAFAVATRATGSSHADLAASIERRIAMGESAPQAWASASAKESLGAVARAAARASDSGAALARAWETTALQLRADHRATAEVAARKVGVHALAPLGLCFLPAFICLGVIPIVIGLAGDIL